MESIVEFALYTWVAVSILAVLVQLVRIVRYRMSNAAKDDARDAEVTEADQVTLDLQQRMHSGDPVGDDAAVQPVEAVHAGGPAGPGASLEELERVEQRVSAVASSRSGTPLPPAPPVQHAATADTPATDTPTARHTDPVESGPSDESVPSDRPPMPAPPEAPAAPAPPVKPTTADTSSAPTEPLPRTLADILAGVRLPWNLLPTVDQARQPSNDRVALLTDGVEPAEVGADVADELERLGFTISTRGEDTAIATRGDDVLGLQIVPEAGSATVGTEARFPSASPTSVALDIWIDA